MACLIHMMKVWKEAAGQGCTKNMQNSTVKAAIGMRTLGLRVSWCPAAPCAIKDAGGPRCLNIWAIKVFEGIKGIWVHPGLHHVFVPVVPWLDGWWHGCLKNLHALILQDNHLGSGRPLRIRTAAEGGGVAHWWRGQRMCGIMGSWSGRGGREGVLQLTRIFAATAGVVESARRRPPATSCSSEDEM